MPPAPRFIKRKDVIQIMANGGLMRANVAGRTHTYYLVITAENEVAGHIRDVTMESVVKAMGGRERFDITVRGGSSSSRQYILKKAE